MFFVAGEDTVAIKQEKVDEARIATETEKRLQVCFCPHGYTTASSGHYHCRHCGLASRILRNILSHEKVHSDNRSPAKKRPKASRRVYNCCYCAYKSRKVCNIKRHQECMHQNDATGIGTGVAEMTSNKVRVSSKSNAVFAAI